MLGRQGHMTTKLAGRTGGSMPATCKCFSLPSRHLWAKAEKEAWNSQPHPPPQKNRRLGLSAWFRKGPSSIGQLFKGHWPYVLK